jgi:hypothetical protein
MEGLARTLAIATAVQLTDCSARPEEGEYMHCLEEDPGYTDASGKDPYCYDTGEDEHVVPGYAIAGEPMKRLTDGARVRCPQHTYARHRKERHPVQESG